MLVVWTNQEPSLFWRVVQDILNFEDRPEDTFFAAYHKGVLTLERLCLATQVKYPVFKGKVEDLIVPKELATSHEHEYFWKRVEEDLELVRSFVPHRFQLYYARPHYYQVP